jgi:hypothetical protein
LLVYSKNIYGIQEDVVADLYQNLLFLLIFSTGKMNYLYASNIEKIMHETVLFD